MSNFLSNKTSIFDWSIDALYRANFEKLAVVLHLIHISKFLFLQNLYSNRIVQHSMNYFPKQLDKRWIERKFKIKSSTLTNIQTSPSNLSWFNLLLLMQLMTYTMKNYALFRFYLKSKVFNNHIILFSVISFSDGSSPITLTDAGTGDATKLVYGGDVPLADSSNFSPTKTYKCSATFSSSAISVDSADFDISPLGKNLLSGSLPNTF